jgi:hypothetical protein
MVRDETIVFEAGAIGFPDPCEIRSISLAGPLEACGALRVFLQVSARYLMPALQHSTTVPIVPSASRGRIQEAALSEERSTACARSSRRIAQESTHDVAE